MAPTRGALVSCGPQSIDLFDGVGGEYETIIAVNTAASRFRCDYWSVGDQHRFDAIEPIGRPVVYTIEAELHKMRGRNGPRISRHDVCTWQQAAAATGADTKTLSYSGPCAIILAVWLQLEQLDAFGVDMAGTADWTGYASQPARPGDPERAAKRWADERAVGWDPLVTWAAGKGLAVTRVGHEGPPR